MASCLHYGLWRHVAAAAARSMMPILTPDMHNVIQRSMLSFVATVNEDGTPNLSPKASLYASNDALFFADIASPQTIENLRRNPAISINVVDVFSRGSA
jgi:predicted pyridoxine 5'-phosphate oxidase superfamily flavin-nucleotide-binding protein